MTAKIFSCDGSHVNFLSRLRQHYENREAKTKTPYATLPRKVVRYGRRPWTPVPVLWSRGEDADALNWAMVIYRQQTINVSIVEPMDVDRPTSPPSLPPPSPSSPLTVQCEGNISLLHHSPPAILDLPTKRCKTATITSANSSYRDNKNSSNNLNKNNNSHHNSNSNSSNRNNSHHHLTHIDTSNNNSSSSSINTSINNHSNNHNTNNHRITNRNHNTNKHQNHDNNSDVMKTSSHSTQPIPIGKEWPLSKAQAEPNAARLSRSHSSVVGENEKKNVVLYFESPLTANKQRTATEEKENVSICVRDVEINIGVDEDSALPLNAPIIEKDEIDFGCSPTFPRRKSAEKREHRKQTKTEGGEGKEAKDHHKKGFWFGKSENKTKTGDENSNAENKSKFKKHHRKSKSVLVPPTYLNIENDKNNEKTTTEKRETNSNTRKSSVGSAPKSSSLTRKLSFVSSPRNTHKRNTSVGNIPKETKSEKLSLFRRFYSTESKKNSDGDHDLATPLKRTRRYTQPVGDIQKEFMLELKGKLDKYSSEHTIKPFNENREKVIWNMHI